MRRSVQAHAYAVNVVVVFHADRCNATCNRVVRYTSCCSGSLRGSIQLPCLSCSVAANMACLTLARYCALMFCLAKKAKRPKLILILVNDGFLKDAIPTKPLACG
jgi:hypothetical protein